MEILKGIKLVFTYKNYSMLPQSAQLQLNKITLT